MSDAIAALLHTASSQIAQAVATLQAEAQSLREQHGQAAAQSRKIQRTLDELAVQRSFAEQLGNSNQEQLREQEQTLREQLRHVDQVARFGNEAQKRLDQFIRQLEMSSTTLTGPQQTGAGLDPWALALRSQVIHGREEERLRLAREVHDGPAQVLANVLMGLEHALNLCASQPTQVANFLPELRDAARTGLKEIRSFIADLRPGALEQGLPNALSEYIRGYERTTGVLVTLELPVWPPNIPKEVEIVIYRVVQEALQNINKHARQAHVTIRGTLLIQTLTLTIRDTGPGFDPREVARRTGKESWGLTSMRERVALVGGEFAIASRPGAGTEVTLRFPF